MQAYLKDEYTEISYSTRIGDARYPLECIVLESGVMGADVDVSFTHPKPDHNRLFLILQGAVDVSMSDRQTRLSSKHMYLLPSYHSFRVTYHAGCKFIYLHFNVLDITGLDIFNIIDGIQLLKNSSYLYREICSQYFEESLMAKIRWQAALFQAICGFLTPQILSQWNTFHDSRKYHDLLQFIRKNCHPQLTVTELSERMNMSRSALSKGFRRQMGFSLKHYIQSLLMHKACRLLVDSNDSIMEIAYKLGYDDPYYFYRVFKKHLLETPLQYRKATRQAKMIAAL